VVLDKYIQRKNPTFFKGRVFVLSRTTFLYKKSGAGFIQGLF